ncbi:MAG TPA: hypothetical protein VFW35_08875 [Sphingomicrobium sp.]|nr:hypothetical protein [Sphingomicrobium sp.]
MHVPLRTAVFAATVMLSGCATIPTTLSQGDHNLIDGAWPYALLAYNSYHRVPDFVLPPRFTRVEYHPNDGIGLAYDVYNERRLDGVSTVFVFRGTEIRNQPKLLKRDNCDFKYGNFSYAQYDEAMAEVDDYVRKHAIPSDRLIFVGHSLGGGIATEATYRYAGSWGYLFDRSPRFQRPAPYNPTATDAFPFRRTSIAQKLEILRFARIAFTPPKEFTLSVSCTGGNPIDRHSMRPLGICLTRTAAGSGDNPIAAEASWTIEHNAALFSSQPPAENVVDPATCPEPVPTMRI